MVPVHLAPCVAVEQLRNVRFNAGLLQGARKALRVYANWEGGHARQRAVVLHAFRRPLRRAWS